MVEKGKARVESCQFSGSQTFMNWKMFDVVALAGNF